ncbi:uncharacterized protein ATNIH1004_004586 [Aspergillus tanneri]|uniref:Uncharacterized protein n=1 Tax=Aspergillus tanneri TaxID=1220188 RepID=A0A5M9MNS6_9EURO|nr:uncharacterized protein ATNIH1004_004586 [Aspergillus tanneri]KAA8648701.1 hypothetical protein ATNIH1004_004586 [Aspergillus tanneri]
MTSERQSNSQNEAPASTQTTAQGTLQFAKGGSSWSSYGGSIYNAVRASSTNDAHASGSINEPNDILDSMLAANMAMLIPLTPEGSTHHNPMHKLDCCTGQGTKHCGCHAHIVSDNCSSHRGLSKSTSGDHSPHRQAASLNDASDKSMGPKWAGGGLLSPARPILPRYPPPERSPTPPGLPSFGSPEAIGYSSQFPVRSAINGQPQLHDRRTLNSHHAADASGARSSGGRWRRILSFASPRSTPPPNQSLCPVARAADGTAVLGRFPYRQGGHSMNVARQLEEHPFHRRTLSMAQCDGGTVDERANSQEEWSIRGLDNMNGRDSTSHADRNPRDRDRATQDVLPPLPNPSISTRPRRPMSTYAFDNSSRCTSYHTCGDQPQGAEAPERTSGSSLPLSSRTSNSAGCLLATTQSTMSSNVHRIDVEGEDKAVSFLQNLGITTLCFPCCLGATAGTDSNTGSHDTYITARSQNSNESATDQAHAHVDPSNHTRYYTEWCSRAWTSLRGFASRNFFITEPMLG